MSISYSHMPSRIIQHLLADLGLVSLGTLPAVDQWPCFSYNEVTSPDDAVFVIDTTGTPQGRIQWDGERVGKEGISITVRSADAEEGGVKARRIDRALMESVLDRTVTINDDEGDPHSYLVHSLGGTTGVIRLGKERTSERHLWTINYLVVIIPQ